MVLLTRERISKNISRFTENVDFIDLEQRVVQTDTYKLLFRLCKTVYHSSRAHLPTFRKRIFKAC